MSLIFQSREQESGRLYKGFIRGNYVLDPKELKPGDKIILVDNGTENMAEVKDQGSDAVAPERKFYASWVNFSKFDGDVWTDNRVFCRWDFDLKNTKVHRAVKVPVNDLNEVNDYTAEEIHSIMQVLNGENKKMEEIANNLDYYREHVTYVLANAMSKLQYAKR